MVNKIQLDNVVCIHSSSSFKQLIHQIESKWLKQVDTQILFGKQGSYCLNSPSLHKPACKKAEGTCFMEETAAMRQKLLFFLHLTLWLVQLASQDQSDCSVSDYNLDLVCSVMEPSPLSGKGLLKVWEARSHHWVLQCQQEATTTTLVNSDMLA